MTHVKLAFSVSTLFLAAAVLEVACRSTADRPTSGTPQDSGAALQLGKAKAATEEAAGAVEEYAYTRKAEFVAKMKKDMGVLQDDLNLLATEADGAGDSAKTDAKAKLAAAREKWAKTRQHLDQVTDATDSTWNDVERGFKESYAELKGSIDTTRQWLSEKLAP